MNPTVTAIRGAEDLASFATSAIVNALKALYNVAGAFNDFIDDHIEKLKASDSPLIASTGRVLEAAKYGFGLGYIGSTILIAAGQYLLGNTFAAIATVASAAVLSNPIAMTCGAIGALYYGWSALTDKERDQILERLAAGLVVGVELIRALVDFSIRKLKELLNPSQLEGAKKYIKEQASQFGKTLYDVTKQVTDLVREGAGRVGSAAGTAGDALADAAGRVGTTVKEGTIAAAEAVTRSAKRVGETVVEGVEAAGDAIKGGAERLGELADSATQRIVSRKPTPYVLTTVPYQAPPVRLNIATPSPAKGVEPVPPKGEGDQ